MADGSTINIFVALARDLQYIKRRIKSVADACARGAAFGQTALVGEAPKKARAPLLRKFAEYRSGK